MSFPSWSTIKERAAWARKAVGAAVSVVGGIPVIQALLQVNHVDPQVQNVLMIILTSILAGGTVFVLKNRQLSFESSYNGTTTRTTIQLPREFQGVTVDGSIELPATVAVPIPTAVDLTEGFEEPVTTTTPTPTPQPSQTPSEAAEDTTEYSEEEYIEPDESEPTQTTTITTIPGV